MDSKCKHNYSTRNNNCGGIPHYFYYNHYQPSHYFQPYAQQQHYFGLGYDRLNMYPNGRFYYDYNSSRNISTMNSQYNNRYNDSSPIKMKTATSNVMHNLNKNKTKYHNLSTEQVNHNSFGENLEVCNQNQKSNNRFINGIKNIVNGFFNPKSNCDLYFEHHRPCNQKYQNSNMKNNIFETMMKDQNTKSAPESHIKTITSDINMVNNDKIVNKTSQTQSSQKTFSNNSNGNNDNSTMNKKMLEYNVTAIFSYDDFPELPIPKGSFWSTKSKCPNKTSNKPSESLKSSSSTSSLSFHKNDKQKHENTKQKENLKDCKYTKNPEDEDSFVIIDKHDKLTNNEKNSTITNSSSSTSSVLPSLCDNNNTQKLDIGSILHQKAHYNRIRQASECSDDSFVICFTNDAAEGVIECFNIKYDDDDDDDNDDDDDEDNIDGDNNEYDNDDLKSNDGDNISFCNNEDYDEIYDNDNDKPNDIENSSEKTGHIKISPDFECVDGKEQDSGFDERNNDKKVRFNLKPEVHVMHVWDYAYRAARKSNWEDYARDRSRFRHRIDNLEVIINPILDENHRNKIYRERFCDNNSNCLINS